MSIVVAGFGVPHTPLFPALVSAKQGPWEQVRAYYADVAERVEGARLDALVIFSSDHFNTFFLDNYPMLAIGVTDVTRGPNDETPQLAVRQIPVQRDLAEAIFTQAVTSGFDLARTEEFSLDHTFTVPLHFLRPKLDIPIVPVFINAFVAPQVSSGRAWQLGEAVRRGIAEFGAGLRVGVLATGSFSLEVGGPRSDEDKAYGVPDPTWAERVCELLRSGAAGKLVEEATPERIAAAGNAAAELLDWIAMLGAIGMSAPELVHLQEAFGHAYAAWPANGNVPG